MSKGKELKRYHNRIATVNETSKNGNGTTGEDLLQSSARVVDDRVRTNEPFFPVDGQTIWNALGVILKKQTQ